jgi:RNA polymerase sigma factor (sigma-70 family)
MHVLRHANRAESVRTLRHRLCAYRDGFRQFHTSINRTWTGGYTSCNIKSTNLVLYVPFGSADGGGDDWPPFGPEVLVIVTTDCIEVFGGDLAKHQMWYAPDRRIKTKSASKLAEQVSDRIGLGVGNEQSDGSEFDLDEQTLFRALHTCAYRATRVARRTPITCEERAEWVKRWRSIREYLVAQNTGLAYMLLTRFRGSNVDEDDMRSDAMFGLSRSVERFNPWRGIRFSTFACNVIVRDLVRRMRSSHRYHQLFPAQHETWREDPPRRPDAEMALRTERVRRALEGNLAELTPLESVVISQRFPTGHFGRRTLQQVGEVLGMSKERVRQIQNRAIDKLRGYLETDPALR